MENDLSPLFEPLKLPGGIILPNRVSMLPMTRVRAAIDGTPTDLMVEYYRQRSGAGIILAESTVVSDLGRGFLYAPGLFTLEQANGWRRVVDAVHQAGGRIILQLNHVGRAANHQHRQPVHAPVAPSAVRIPLRARKITVSIGRVTPYDIPRALHIDEIPLIVEEFAHTARMARSVGFDGVQVHADSGYLIHQFLSTNVNLRDDRYGGSPRNRARFALEVLDAVVAATAPEYVSIKFTPGFRVHDAEEDDIDEKYDYLIGELNQRSGLSFLHLYFQDLRGSSTFRRLRKAFNGLVLAEGSLGPADNAAMLREGLMDFTGVGRAYIANPDYVERLRIDAPMSAPISETIYGAGAEGYTDYPMWNPAAPDESVIKDFAR